MTSYGTQFRLVARGLVDYLAGIDPSAVGLVGALLILIRSRGVPSRNAKTPGQRTERR
jgi:hypothetical protein